MSFINTLKLGFQNHSGAILTGTGLVLNIAGAVWLGKACVDANKALEAKVKKVERPLTREEKFKMTYKYFIIPGGLLIMGAGCHIFCRVLDSKKQAGLVAVATASETAYSALKGQVKQLGPRKGEQIENQALQNIAQNDLPKGGDVIVSTGKGDTLMYDKFSGRWFRSSTDELLRAQNVINEYLLSGDPVASNEFWQELGLNSGDSDIGNLMGWHMDSDGLINVGWVGSAIPYDNGENEEPYLIIKFDPEPQLSFDYRY